MKNINRNNEIVELRNKGMTLESIGERYGISRQRVFQILAVVDNQKRKAKIERNAKVIADRKSGMAIAELAWKYRVSRPTVYYILRGEK